MVDIEELKKMRKPREVTKFNIWIKYCLIKTMGDNRDIGVTAPKAMAACAFAHRNRNVPVEPIETDKRIRMFLTGEIDPTDPKWMSTKKDEVVRRFEKARDTQFSVDVSGSGGQTVKATPSTTFSSATPTDAVKNISLQVQMWIKDRFETRTGLGAGAVRG